MFFFQLTDADTWEVKLGPPMVEPIMGHCAALINPTQVCFVIYGQLTQRSEFKTRPGHLSKNKCSEKYLDQYKARPNEGPRICGRLTATVILYMFYAHTKILKRQGFEISHVYYGMHPQNKYN